MSIFIDRLKKKEKSSNLQDLKDKKLSIQKNTYQLQKIIQKKPYIERLFIRQVRQKPDCNLDQQLTEALSLRALDPKEVFKKRLRAAYPGGETIDLLQTFDEAMELMKQVELV